MPFEVLGKEVQVLKQIGEHITDDGKVIGYDHESVTWLKGDKIPDGEISPVVVKQYEDGNEHVLSLLKRVDEAKPRGRKPVKKEEESESAK